MRGLGHLPRTIRHSQPLPNQHRADITIRRREVGQRAPVAVFPAGTLDIDRSAAKQFGDARLGL